MSAPSPRPPSPPFQAFSFWKETGAHAVGDLGTSDIPSPILSVIHDSWLIGNGISSNARVKEEALENAAAKLSLITQDLNSAQLWDAERASPLNKPPRKKGSKCTDNGDNDSGREGRQGRSESDNDDRPNDRKGSGKIAWRDEDETPMSTTVLIGLPGSGVLTLAAAVLRFSSGAIDWIPVVFNALGKGLDGPELLRAIE